MNIEIFYEASTICCPRWTSRIEKLISRKRIVKIRLYEKDNSSSLIKRRTKIGVI